MKKILSLFVLCAMLFTAFAFPVSAETSDGDVIILEVVTAGSLSYVSDGNQPLYCLDPNKPAPEVGDSYTVTKSLASLDDPVVKVLARADEIYGEHYYDPAAFHQTVWAAVWSAAGYGDFLPAVCAYLDGAAWGPVYNALVSEDEFIYSKSPAEYVLYTYTPKDETKQRLVSLEVVETTENRTVIESVELATVLASAHTTSGETVYCLDASKLSPSEGDVYSITKTVSSLEDPVVKVLARAEALREQYGDSDEFNQTVWAAVWSAAGYGDFLPAVCAYLDGTIWGPVYNELVSDEEFIYQPETEGKVYKYILYTYTPDNNQLQRLVSLEVIETIAEDINGDLAFDVFDYLTVKNIYFNSGAYTEGEIAAADINCDDKTDMFDYLSIKSAYFKK